MKNAGMLAALAVALCLAGAVPASAAPTLTWASTPIKFDHGFLPTVAAGYTGTTLSGSQFVSVHQGSANAGLAWWNYGTKNSTALVNKNTVSSASNRLSPSVALFCANDGPDTGSQFIEVEADPSGNLYYRTIRKSLSGADVWSAPSAPMAPGLFAGDPHVASDGHGTAVVVFDNGPYETYYMVGQVAQRGNNCPVLPGDVVTWYTPQLLDDLGEGPSTVAVAPVNVGVDNTVDLVIEVNTTVDGGLYYHAGCLYTNPSPGFSASEPGDGAGGGPIGTIGCGFTTAKALPNAANAIDASVAIASLSGNIFSEPGPPGPYAFAAVVFPDGTGTCPALYSETATISNLICTISTVPSDAGECLPKPSVSITWSGRHHYDCGFHPQISLPNQMWGGSTGAPKTIHGLEVHTDNNTGLWQHAVTLTH
jgi:hypothetical protein